MIRGKIFISSKENIYDYKNQLFMFYRVAVCLWIIDILKRNNEGSTKRTHWTLLLFFLYIVHVVLLHIIYIMPLWGQLGKTKILLSFEYKQIVQNELHHFESSIKYIHILPRINFIIHFISTRTSPSFIMQYILPAVAKQFFLCKFMWRHYF